MNGNQTSLQDNTRAPAQPVTPIIFWAIAGAVFLSFELYTWCSWIFGPNFRPTDPGPDPISQGLLDTLFNFQLMMSVFGLLGVWFFIIRPSLRERRFAQASMFATVFWMLVFYDCTLNYASTSLLYNSYMFNMGSWSLGSMPGWMSPNGNQLPMPIFMIFPAYIGPVFFKMMLACWIARKIQGRYPSLSGNAVFCIVVALPPLLNAMTETLALSGPTGVYAYPAAIRSLSLFPGELHQHPMSQLFTWGAGFGAISALWYFKDNHGNTVAERGIERINVSGAASQCLRFLALIGCTRIIWLAIVIIPNQWIALNGDPFPGNIPSYLENGLCAYGESGDKCPGPGVLMPRLEK